MISQELLITRSNLQEAEIESVERVELSALEKSILRAVTYSDVFDFPLTAGEIQRNLVNYVATPAEVQAALDGGHLVPYHLEDHDGYFTLPGRRMIVGQRRLRQEASAALWKTADYYGRLIAQLPFVRMVAVTGALAVNNAEPEDDIDYLIVTKPGRLWLCRALAILMVKRATKIGVHLCPNYFLSERALALPERDLYTAHELLQMVPVAGFQVYQRMLALNDWACGLLPTAVPRRGEDLSGHLGKGGKARLAEKLLGLWPVSLLERWEMKRKITRFNEKIMRSWPYSSMQLENQLHLSDANHGGSLNELCFNADCCKGHFDLHGQHTLTSYEIQMFLVDDEQ